jgi:hypothetical protein
MYQQASQENPSAAGTGPEAGAQEAAGAGADDDVVDADFEEVKEEKK